MNRTIEDYLRAIYRIGERDGKVANAALANELGISAAAVTEMLRKLADAGMLRYKKYQGASLTKAGREAAVETTRRHRLWEVFLIEHLNFKWDQVHELAHQLEHINSEELIDRLDDFLGNPTHDPHGDPIPAKDGTIVQRDLVAISGMQPEETGVVARVSDEYPELLRYASSLGLRIKTQIAVLDRISFDGSVRLKADGKESVISEKLADSVFVERKNEALQSSE